MTIFDEATAVRPAGAGRYDIRPDERFALLVPGGGAPPAVNGGVLIATVLRCVLDSSPHPHPVATSAHFLRVPRLAPAQVEVTWLKAGRTAATARASLIQDGQPALEVTISTGTVPGAGGGDGSTGLSWTGAPPVLPPIEDCVDIGPWPGPAGTGGPAGADGPAGPGARLGYAGQVEMRLDPATAGWRRGEPAGIPEMRGYFRLREDRDPDAYLLALAVDGMPPVVFGLGATSWAPTVELTWNMRAGPAPGTLIVAARCRHVGGGWFDEEAEVWDAAGQLVAQSRQIARVGRGDQV